MSCAKLYYNVTVYVIMVCERAPTATVAAGATVVAAAAAVQAAAQRH